MEQDSHKLVAVAGNIGAGKTTLVNLLAKHFGWRAYFEAVDENPYLEDFYQDMKRWAFPTQIFFLQSRFTQMLELQQMEESLIQDRTIYEDAYIFAKNLHQSGTLTDRDYETYLRLFQGVKKMVRTPDLLIYLKASIPTLIRQIGNRGRAYETNISLKYLGDLNQHYDDWIAEYREGELLILDADKLDLLDSPEDVGLIFRRVQAKLGESLFG
ncbi:MAG: deoxynucleoside kinase [Bacteroidota bacterium]